MSNTIVLPDHDRPLPAPADLDRLMQCPYAVLVVAGRSGSGLIQAHLDGHRQIAQIPAIWKFHDFLAQTRGLLQAGPTALARACAEFPAHEPLFDTRRSIHVAGQLGNSGHVSVSIDRDAYQRAMTEALGDRPIDPRRALYAAVLAYEWCLGRDYGEARVLFHHLHHGDWLWPEFLIDRYNLGRLTPQADVRVGLKPDLLLVSLRSPRDIVRSYPSLTAAVTKSGTERVGYYEHLLRLLAQDWLRARVSAGSGIVTAGIRLEDMKADITGTLAELCRLLGVDADDPALAATTYYGHPWTEDTWSVARKEVAARTVPDRDISWQDEAFIMGALSGLAEEQYKMDASYADWNNVLRLLMQSAEDPPLTVFPGLEVTPAGKQSAADLMWERISFMERFRALVGSQSLGSLRLCRRAGG